MIFQLNDKIVFPDPALADEDGLLAVGGDLSTERLIAAYRLGIFPWYSEHDPILWYSPHERFVIEPAEIHITHSMRQLINSGKYQVKWNTAFEDVIKNCASVPRKDQPGTWINADMMKAYIILHQKKIAQSVEVYEDETLVGGLYGVVMGKVFCGESMFSLRPNSSKLALIALCQCGRFTLIDCQMYTEHLEKMGAKFIGREEFMSALRD